jgi:triosephosphate isomerase
MKQLLTVANWKSNKTEKEALEWFKNFPKTVYNPQNTGVVCPPFTLLAICKKLVLDNNLNLKIGGQDVSLFDSGAHTGEINAKQLKEFADYVIIGHSERRQMGEAENILEEKVKMANLNDLKVIYCISSLSQQIPEEVKIIAYEPVFAIGTGTPDSPENAQKMAEEIKKKNDVKTVLYGGSVTSQNVKSFIQMPGIDGVLVGGASLNPAEFSKILEA